MRRQDGEGGRMVRRDGGMLLILPKAGDAGPRASPRFHLFVSDANQGKE